MESVKKAMFKPKKHIMKQLLFLVIILALDANISAQDTMVTGVIKNNHEEVLKKVEIYVDMKQVAGNSNKRGEYKFKHPKGFKLITIFEPKYGFINWKYNGEEKVDFVFPEDYIPMTKKEFLGLGYTQTKDLKEYEKNFYANYSSILQILDNRFKEVQVKGDKIMIVNRGVNSAMVQEPFILVNDIPTDVGNLETIPTSEVKTIRVISKGSEAAAYGQRGANGIIIIQLKTAEDEKK